jgi:preprotein translocase subunit SecA
MSSFQFDYLRHNFERTGIMGERKPENNWVILDEVDSLVIDQGGNIAKLSNPFAGM